MRVGIILVVLILIYVGYKKVSTLIQDRIDSKIEKIEIDKITSSIDSISLMYADSIKTLRKHIDSIYRSIGHQLREVDRIVSEVDEGMPETDDEILEELKRIVSEDRFR